jgi:hypothetical protein
MVSLTRTARNSQRPFARRNPLSLEPLETRDCPTLLLGSSLYVDSPTLSLHIDGVGPQRSVLVSGDVTGTPFAAGRAVTLAGVVNDVVYTDANGHYRAREAANSLGTIYAETTDGLSNIAQAVIQAPDPVISNFTWTNNLGLWTFSGVVNAPDLTEMTVTLQNFNEKLNVQVTVGSSGAFSYTLALNMPTDMGTATCDAIDVWGQSAQTAYTYVY